MSFDLNILVNGNRCKQYYHQGKTFIEAKAGSEYVIEVRNNHYKRVLAVGSVDSLNVLTGKTATPDDSGYIIGAYSSEKIKGFRFSDDEWAMFRFGYKFYGNTYAQSKEDGSEKNCGIIGVKFFYEKEPVVIYSSPPVQWNVTPQWLTPTPSPTVAPPWVSNPPGTTYAISASWTAGPTFHGTGGYQSNVNYSCNNFNLQNMVEDNYIPTKGGGYISPGCSTREADMSSTLSEAIADAKAVRQTALANSKGCDTSHKLSGKVKRSRAGGQSVAAASVGGLYGEGRFGYSDDTLYERDLVRSLVDTPKAEFDMGTEWGRKERSRVNTVPFDKGGLACSIDIYYASREALIAMGVPIYNALSSNLPQSFPDKYAQPPKGWVG